MKTAQDVKKERNAKPKQLKIGLFACDPSESGSEIQKRSRPVGDTMMSNTQLYYCLLTYCNLLEEEKSQRIENCSRYLNTLLTRVFRGQLGSLTVRTQMQKISKCFQDRGLPILDDFEPEAEVSECEALRIMQCNEILKIWKRKLRCTTSESVPQAIAA